MTIILTRRRVAPALLALALAFPLILLAPSSAPPAQAASPDVAVRDGVPGRYVAFASALTLWVDLVHRAAQSAVRTGALAPSPPPSTGSLVPDLLTRIRDTGGDTDGNGDWIAQCGETIELLTWIDNIGSDPVTGVVGTMTTDDPYVEVLYNDRSTFPDIGPGLDALGDDDWDLRIAEDVPDLHIAHLTMAVTSESLPPTTLTYTLLIHCDGRPADHDVRIALGRTTIDDGVAGESRGNNDGSARCGETVELHVGLENTTDAPIKGVTARLIVDDPALTLLYNDTSDYPRIPPGKARQNEDDWDLRIADIGTDERIVTFRIEISTVGETYQARYGFMVYCDRGILSLWNLELDDGPTGDSVGNGDGVAQCGETVEIKLELANIGGDRPLTDIEAVFVAKDPALTVLHNSTAVYPDIVRGWSSWGSNDWDLAIGAVPDGHVARFDVAIEYDGGRSHRSNQKITIECDRPPPVFVTARTIDDGIFGDSAGDNDRRAECGETIELYLELENVSGLALEPFEARLSTDDPHVAVLYNSIADYPSIGAGASEENHADWDIRIGEGVPDRHQAQFTLTIDALDLTLDVPVTLRCSG
jgi:hypothetical protein